MRVIHSSPANYGSSKKSWRSPRPRRAPLLERKRQAQISTWHFRLFYRQQRSSCRSRYRWRLVRCTTVTSKWLLFVAASKNPTARTWHQQRHPELRHTDSSKIHKLVRLKIFNAANQSRLVCWELLYYSRYCFITIGNWSVLFIVIKRKLHRPKSTANHLKRRHCQAPATRAEGIIRELQ